MPFWSVSPEPRPSSSLPAPPRSSMPALAAPASDRAGSEAPSSGSSDDPISIPSVSPRFHPTAPRMQSHQEMSRSAILPPARPGEESHSTPTRNMQQASLAAQSPTLGAPVSTTRKQKDSGVAKGTGPELDSSARRDRPSVTYNLKELTYKSRSPSKPSSPKKESGPDSAVSLPSPRPSRSSTGTPPIYNLKDLIGQTKVSRATHRAAQKFMKKWNKEQAGLRKASKRSVQAGPDHADNHNDDGEEDDDHQQEQDSQHFPQQLQSKRQKTTHDGPVSASLQQRVSATSGLTSSNAAAKNVSKLTSYLAPILRNRGVIDPYALLKLDWFKDLLSLPQQRTVHWNLNGRASTWSYRQKIDLSSLLIQITGESPPQPCERCASGGGLYQGCFVISPKINPGSIYGCANCLYNGRQTFCSLKEWGKQRSERASAAALDATRKAWTSQAPAANGNGSCASMQASPVSYHSPATQAQETLTPVSYQYQQGEAAQGDAQSAYASHQATSLAAAGMSTATMRSMEPWEKAPGRVRSSASGKPENIAFSKSFLASGKEIQVCNEASFKVEVIRSGHSRQFPQQPGVLRLCSIASGKLSVKMEHEEPFVIGPHGMFRIGPHASCFVDSDLYDDVVVHITSIKTDDD